MDKTLVVIGGPTASGKTRIAIDIAKHFNTEIISCDSRQFYKELNIGTAKPSESELLEVKHHFINSHSIVDSFSAGDFYRLGNKILRDLFKQLDIIVMVGGSGMYIKAFCEGLDSFPKVSPETREAINELYNESGLEGLKKKIVELDPAFLDYGETENPARLKRALEVSIDSGKPYSTFRTNTKKKKEFETIKIALEWNRKTLYERINKRVDLMIDSGLVEEVKNLLPIKQFNALNTVGYKEVFDYLEGKEDLNTTIELIKRNSRRYAKRQITWFKNADNFHWINPNSAEIIDYIIKLKAKKH